MKQKNVNKRTPADRKQQSEEGCKGVGKNGTAKSRLIKRNRLRAKKKREASENLQR